MRWLSPRMNSQDIDSRFSLDYHLPDCLPRFALKFNWPKVTQAVAKERGIRDWFSWLLELRPKAKVACDLCSPSFIHSMINFDLKATTIFKPNWDRHSNSNFDKPATGSAERKANKGKKRYAGSVDLMSSRSLPSQDGPEIHENFLVRDDTNFELYNMKSNLI